MTADGSLDAQCCGTAFGANADVRKKYWKLVAGEDLIREYESSPGVFRAFCSRCGSPVYSRRSGAPDVYRMRLGPLNDDPGRRALAHFAAGPAEHGDELAALITQR